MESFIGWIGGKRALRDEIISRFPTTPSKRYIEVCGGAGWVFFRKQRAPGQLEIFNDVNGELINLFKCVKFHEPELCRWMEDVPFSRELFEDFRVCDLRGLTDIQRAVRYFYMIRSSFGANCRSFAAVGHGIGKALDKLPMIRDRLRGVVLENLDFEALIHSYDRTDALFYVDPPYMGSESLYENPFTSADHDRLCAVLRAVKGRFILSYNDCKKVRETYSWASVEGVGRKNLLSKKGGEEFSEVIIRNYDQ